MSLTAEFSDGIAGHMLSEDQHRRVCGDRIFAFYIGRQYRVKKFIGAGLAFSAKRGKTVCHLNRTDLVVGGQIALFSSDFLSAGYQKIKDCLPVTVIGNF